MADVALKQASKVLNEAIELRREANKLGGSGAYNPTLYPLERHPLRGLPQVGKF